MLLNYLKPLFYKISKFQSPSILIKIIEKPFYRKLHLFEIYFF